MNVSPVKMKNKSKALRVLPLRGRRQLVLVSLALVAGAVVGVQTPSVQAQAQPPLVEVWKSPTCGCCAEWIKHMEANGFRVNAYDKGNTAIRKALGMPLKFGSCHTAKVNGYVVEGHVPAREVHRLLREKPVALGLSVPEMPIGTPGMDSPEYGGQVDPYDVLLVKRDGSSAVYQSYTLKRSGK